MIPVLNGFLPEQLIKDIAERDDWSCTSCGNALWGNVDEEWTLWRRIPVNEVADPADARDLWGPANLTAACMACAALLDTTDRTVRQAARARGIVLWRSQDPTMVPVQAASGINQPKNALARRPGIVTRAWLLDGHRRRRLAPGRAAA